MDYIKEKEKKHFDELAQKYKSIWWGSKKEAGKERLKRRGNIVKEYLKYYNNPKVLEVGCGTGDFTKYVINELLFSRYYAIDISPVCIKIAASRYAIKNRIIFRIDDAISLKFRNNTFDMVIGNGILHHLPVGKALKEYFRILKPEGMICFFEPNMLNPQVFIEKNIKVIGKLLQNTENETAFIKWKIKKLLMETGFKNIIVKPFDFLHPATFNFLIKPIDKIGKFLENVPFIKEITGSLMIIGKK